MKTQEDAMITYNELFKTNKFCWSEIGLSELPASTRQYVDMWLVDFGITFKLHKPVIDNVFVFKVDNDLVVYLICDANTSQHMWGDKNFDNLNNNKALAALVAQGAGIEGAEHAFDMIDELQNYKNN